VEEREHEKEVMDSDAVAHKCNYLNDSNGLPSILKYECAFQKEGREHSFKPSDQVDIT
jgi:hypothetical protein